MLTYFIVFNCLPLLQPYTAEIALNMRSLVVFEKCTIHAGEDLISEVNVLAKINGQTTHVTHYLNDNCDFTSVPYAEKFNSRKEADLFNQLPQYFFRYPEWNTICKKLW